MTRDESFTATCVACKKPIDGEFVTLKGSLPKEIGGGKLTTRCHKSCWDEIEKQMNRPQISIGFQVDEAMQPQSGTFSARFVDPNVPLPGVL